MDLFTMMATKNIRGKKTSQYKGRKAIKLQSEQQPWKSMAYTCPMSLIILPFSVVSSRIDLWYDESIEIQGQVHGLCDEIEISAGEGTRCYIIKQNV